MILAVSRPSSYSQFAHHLSNLGLQVREDVPLRELTRFQIGGDVRLLAETSDENLFLEGMRAVRTLGLPWLALGAGTNLIASDDGFPGVILRFRGARLELREASVYAESGAELQDLVDFTISAGLEGLHTMTRIPGWVGGAVYGNAGAYGNSIGAAVEGVRFFDGRVLRGLDHDGCRFGYRDSIFKHNKDWIILSVTLTLPPGSAEAMRRRAEEIRSIRDAKYPPSMRCAGSIFKNLLVSELPEQLCAALPPGVVIEGKLPAGWLLDQVGAKGMRRGDIQVAAYHANTIYNDGEGKSEDLCALINDLKARVRARFGIQLEEEVQYIGF
ncbi:MAG: UDP-N-acetylmuramate dehydrogenase [Acidobacteria bacterium]|nr:UDP-N-acetylmuramate dehydrogenase [Acidobacteriota bacterium]